MISIDIYFRDLKSEMQTLITEAWNTAEQDENWDVFPIFTFVRENDETDETQTGGVNADSICTRRR